MINQIANIMKAGKIIGDYGRQPYFGFTQAHAHLNGMDERLVMQADADAVPAFEAAFAAAIGQGKAISFATGRMGFYAVMQALGLGAGDEVILQGATCAVMANAVLRRGAQPVFADIDPVTYGSNAASIAAVVSSRTRMIVAQHSFGIPCDIEPIASLANDRGIFLLEDCALSFGSKRNRKIVGRFGDAALFSTDHTKPINTLVGGLIYTEKSSLGDLLKRINEHSAEVSHSRQRHLARQLLLEASHATPETLGKLRLKSLVRRKLFKQPSGFFDQDFANRPSGYAFPQRMPAFLAQIGLNEISEWPEKSAQRKQTAKQILGILKSVGLEDNVSIYSDPSLEIEPLRIAYHTQDAVALRERLHAMIDTNAFWFGQALVGAKTDERTFGYVAGACPNAERIWPLMINLPCNLSEQASIVFIQELDKVLRKHVSKKRLSL